MSAKKPQTFSEWYQYFCKNVGCEYNKDYKPSNLPELKALRQKDMTKEELVEMVKATMTKEELFAVHGGSGINLSS